mmetsp:Transcript_33549/g.62850  ORF Transcript_33549/g.62850 Transcript_33549/m.62850 type:complete len:187 (+) Transcript_33549:51-611(+)
MITSCTHAGASIASRTSSSSDGDSAGGEGKCIEIWKDPAMAVLDRRYPNWSNSCHGAAWLGQLMQSIKIFKATGEVADQDDIREAGSLAMQDPRGAPNTADTSLWCVRSHDARRKAQSSLSSSFCRNSVAAQSSAWRSHSHMKAASCSLGSTGCGDGASHAAAALPQGDQPDPPEAEPKESTKTKK